MNPHHPDLAPVPFTVHTDPAGADHFILKTGQEDALWSAKAHANTIPYLGGAIGLEPPTSGKGKVLDMGQYLLIASDEMTELETRRELR